MITHLCLISYSSPEAVDADLRRAIEAAYRKLPSLIPGIVSLQVGHDLELLEGNADLAILASFESKDAFLNYSTHAAHAEVIFPVLGPHMQGYSTAQFAADAVS